MTRANPLPNEQADIRNNQKQDRGYASLHHAVDDHSGIGGNVPGKYT